MRFPKKVCLLCVFVMSYFLSAVSNSTSFERSTYIVYMDKLVMPKIFSNHKNWYSSIIDSFKFLHPISLDVHQSSSSLLYTYEHAFDGFSVVLSLSQLKILKKLLGFISAHKDETVTLDTTHTTEYISLNPLTGLWPISNYGENIIIGIIDSGIWPESPSFEDHNMTKENPKKWKGLCEGGDNFNSSMCNSKIIGVRYFNKGLKKELGKEIANSARDTLGHGTQVASIAAGNFAKEVSFFGYAKGTAKGIAPLAKLAIYKVSWAEGMMLSDILCGINQAIFDGVDIISISLSPREHKLFEDPMAIASFSAMKNGIFVSSSAGNKGPTLGKLSNEYPWVLTVASSTIDRWFAGILTLGNGQIVIGWSMFFGDSFIQNFPLVYDNTIAACNSVTKFLYGPNGIILCNIGDIQEQMEAIRLSNRFGAILVYSDPIRLELINISCPCIVIRTSDAPTIIAYVEKNSKANASIKFKETILDTKNAPAVPYYSSRGPSPTFPNILKPDIIAPGVLILAASIPELKTLGMGIKQLKSNYTIVSGTSFAVPHVAGVAALLKSAHPEWSIAAIKSAIMTTANTYDNTRNPIRAYGDHDDYEYASPLQMGAGHINPNQAFNPGLIYDLMVQDYVNLLCSLKHDKEQMMNITTSKTYNCSSTSSDLNYPSFISLYNDTITPIVEKFRRTVTNVGEGPAIYMVNVTTPHGCKITVSPEILGFTKKYERQSYVVTISHKGNQNQIFEFGSLLWVEQNVSLALKHKVRSPIIIAPYKI